MALGLSCIPHKIRGDMEEVQKLNGVIGKKNEEILRLEGRVGQLVKKIIELYNFIGE